MTVSIIIPTLNESEHIGRLLAHLQQHADQRLLDLLVVDGGSQDNTCELAAQHGARALQSPEAGRAQQMNYGATLARGEILYFVHADCLPPATYLDDIDQALAEGFPIGTYRSAFESNSLLLKVNAYFTRFDFLWCRGGDQSIFVARDLFEELGGYRVDYCIMEEYDLMARAREQCPFKIIPKATLISARKYESNSYARVQVANLVVFNMFRLGFPPMRLAKIYRKLLNYSLTTRDL